MALNGHLLRRLSKVVFSQKCTMMGEALHATRLSLSTLAKRDFCNWMERELGVYYKKALSRKRAG
jgi:hypothetical protein